MSKNNVKNEEQFSITQINLDRKGKTNKKIKLNPKSSKYLSSFGHDLKEKCEKRAKESFKKGRKTKIKIQKLKEKQNSLEGEKIYEKRV